ncbi:MAG: nucleotidyl transferase AbiEii/AbiGii toxin family protein [Acidobacteriota bacterium]
MESNEIFDTLNDLVVRLNDLGVEYMITGSVAMSSYVPARSTMDIDVIIEIERSDLERFEQRFAGDYYVSLSSIRQARERNSMFNVMNFETGIKIDFITRKPNAFEAAKFGRRRRSRIGDIEFWVISKEDLILSKLCWAKDSHSERQFEDVRSLFESGADTATIEQEIATQGLGEVWEAYGEWMIRAQK